MHLKSSNKTSDIKIKFSNLLNHFQNEYDRTCDLYITHVLDDVKLKFPTYDCSIEPSGSDITLFVIYVKNVPLEKHSQVKKKLINICNKWNGPLWFIRHITQ